MTKKFANIIHYYHPYIIIYRMRMVAYVHTKMNSAKKAALQLLWDSLILNMIGHTFRSRNYSDST